MKIGRPRDEKGIALFTAILLLLALGVLGFTAVNLANVGTKITSNTQTSKQAFYIAEAGIEIAREKLRAQGMALTPVLNSVKGPNGVLTDSSSAANFATTDDIPYVNTTSLANGTFKVYLTNDAEEGVTSTTDINGIVTLTSFGYGPDNAKAVIQVTIKQGGGIPSLPGAITMPGPHVTFLGGNSNASSYSGDATHPAIAVNSADSLTETINGIPANRRDNYTGGGISPPSVQNMTFPDPWGNVTKLQELYNTVKGIADYTSPTDPGFNLGNVPDRRVVVIDGDFTLGGGSTGAGILLVTGNLTLNGNISYDGMVLVMGKGNIRRTGGGNGVFTGGIFVGNISGPDGNINTTEDNTFGPPVWDTSGGGTSDIDYVLASETNALGMLPFARLTWKQLGL